MIEVVETDVFSDWLQRLRDPQAKARILVRIRRVALGNFGDVAPVGEGISELRIHYGPGYRIYLASRGEALVILLCGGDKRTQAKDIVAAKALAKSL
ncbi:type II toxin-antitoxin system RelE/ParE family toxin [Aliihoeflea aestuarii]|uniref:type II toxin-antitoxin system RelE/ParE family toxin n=1 Tax=Aliihoeflea aestuarii TaxID=453840 RepID=UPI00209310B2|nr:type II toxin-antitoxin system RelE/ParE family toxin [Aliihoeflea aestuarii]MCO6390201.1 type II toxin-antitoxin system RelE/ParE family toxin [Aliihoeflea aestuarii]